MSKHLSEHEAELKQFVGDPNWVAILAFSFHAHRAYGRGIIQLSHNGEPEEYIVEQGLDQNQKSQLNSYDMNSLAFVRYPVAQENILIRINSTEAEEASFLHQAHRTREDGIYHDHSSTKLIRLADIHFYERILQVALDITDKLYDTIKVPYRKDVVQLAIRLIGQAQTLFHLGSPSVSLIPRLGGRKPISDISSITSIFRTIVETYLTMHEVFFSPKDDNDFDFFHSRWMLIGLHNIKKHTRDEVYDTFAPKEVEPLRIKATKRMEETTQYREMLSKKKTPKKTLATLVNRTRDAKEWERIALSANIDASAYQHMYSGYSGYIHSDGYTSYRLNHDEAFGIDFHIETLLFIANRIVSKVINDFAKRYTEANQIATSNTYLYPFIKHYSRRVSDDDLSQEFIDSYLDMFKE